VYPTNPNSTYSWLITYLCRVNDCGKKFFSCDGSCDRGRRGGDKVFETEAQVKRHHRQCHEKQVPSKQPFRSKLSKMRMCLTQSANHDNIVPNIDDPVGKSTLSLTQMSSAEEDGFPNTYDDVHDGNFEETEHTENQPPHVPFISLQHHITSSFQREIVAGNAMKAASILVHRATLQGKSVLGDNGGTSLTPKNILLFLYLSKLVIGIGQLQQENLSHVFKIFYP
jgi:hypothetical protein